MRKRTDIGRQAAAIALSVACAACVLLSACDAPAQWAAVWELALHPAEDRAAGGNVPCGEAGPGDSEETLQDFLGDPDSRYGRERLGEEEQAVYDRLREAALRFCASVPLDTVSADQLKPAMRCLRRDYPELFWMSEAYRYSVDETGLCVELSYTLEKEEAGEQARKLEEAADRLLEGISMQLPEFDRALLIHDRLVTWIRYDREAERPNTLEGALLDRRATCEGYARAYQYLLSRVGIEALILYGNAGEPHAWNAVRIGDSYLLCDLTWDDVVLKDGTELLSHTYFLRDSVFFSATHEPLGSEVNYPIPECGPAGQSYFARTETLLTDTAEEEIRAVLSRAADRAAAYGYASVEIGLASSELAGTLEEDWIPDGKLDLLAQELCDRRGLELRGRVWSRRKTALAYVVNRSDTGGASRPKG